jgi:hypothetical protein
MSVPRLIFICLILGFAFHTFGYGATVPQGVVQSSEVVEAYHVCADFERMMRQDLDFDRAFEATFTKDRARRRALAIVDGEFGDLDFESIDDATLIRAYKRRMQIFYLMLPLASPGDQEQRVFFPADIMRVIKREAPPSAQQFGAYAAQLDRDVVHFRAHLEKLARENPAAAERLRQFKTETLDASLELPDNYKVEPMSHYYRSSVLKGDEPYYEIKGYAVARENGKMRIVGIRFFTRLF